MNRTVLIFALASAALAMTACQRTETVATSPAAGSSGSAAPTGPIASFQTGVEGVSLIRDRESGCEYFSTTNGNQPRLASPGAVKCEQSTAIFQPTGAILLRTNGNANDVAVLVDRDTGCHYLVNQPGVGAAVHLTPRLAETGQPFCRPR